VEIWSFLRTHQLPNQLQMKTLSLLWLDRFIFENHKKKLVLKLKNTLPPCFSFITKTGMILSEAGVSFLLWTYTESYFPSLFTCLKVLLKILIRIRTSHRTILVNGNTVCLWMAPCREIAFTLRLNCGTEGSPAIDPCLDMSVCTSWGQNGRNMWWIG